jgi:hypothetical protein
MTNKTVKNGVVFTRDDKGRIIKVNFVSESITKNALDTLIKLEKERQENSFRWKNLE